MIYACGVCGSQLASEVRGVVVHHHDGSHSWVPLTVRLRSSWLRAETLAQLARVVVELVDGSWSRF